MLFSLEETSGTCYNMHKPRSHMLGEISQSQGTKTVWFPPDLRGRGRGNYSNKKVASVLGTECLWSPQSQEESDQMAQTSSMGPRHAPSLDCSEQRLPRAKLREVSLWWCLSNSGAHTQPCLYHAAPPWWVQKRTQCRFSRHFPRVWAGDKKESISLWASELTRWGFESSGGTTVKAKAEKSNNWEVRG